MHIEVVPSLDTSSCVMGIERFIARRGTPTTIMSDNGTNFVGLVRSVKRVLYDTLGNRRVTEEVLRTTLCLVEQSLNARPITAVSTNPLDLEALTPNHFILGQYAASFPSLSFEENFDHKSGSPERNHTLTQYGHGGCGNTWFGS